MRRPVDALDREPVVRRSRRTSPIVGHAAGEVVGPGRRRCPSRPCGSARSYSSLASSMLSRPLEVDARRSTMRSPSALLDRSDSSVISPTSSSRTSSSVTSPAVPPYSSTTTKRWLLRRRISASRVRPVLVSGTKCAGPMWSRTSVVAPAAATSAAEVAQVDRCPRRRRRPRRAPAGANGPTAIARSSALAHGRAVRDVDHVGARHHHLAHDRVAELDDRVDELALVGLR